MQEGLLLSSTVKEEEEEKGIHQVLDYTAEVVGKNVTDLIELLNSLFFTASSSSPTSNFTSCSLFGHSASAMHTLCTFISDQQIFGEVFLTLQPHELSTVIPDEVVDLFVDIQKFITKPKSSVMFIDSASPTTYTDVEMDTRTVTDVNEDIDIDSDASGDMNIDDDLKPSHLSSTVTSFALGSRGWKTSLPYIPRSKDMNDDGNTPITYGTLVVMGATEYFKSHNDRLDIQQQHSPTSEYKMIGANNKKYVLKQKFNNNIDNSHRKDDMIDVFQIGSAIDKFNDISIRGELNVNEDMEITTSVSKNACQVICQRKYPYQCFINVRASLLSGSKKKPTKIKIYRPGMSYWITLSLTNYYTKLNHNSIIDINGVLLLFKSGVDTQPPVKSEPRKVINQFNSMRASCPVMMSTLAFEHINENERNMQANNCWKKPVGRYLHEIDVDVYIDDDGSINGMKTSKATCIEPWVFAACGHVHGYSESLEGGNCPLCRCVSPFVSIQMPFESMICDQYPTHVFNPCGHAASLECVQFYAKVPTSSVSNRDDLNAHTVADEKSKPAITPCCPFCGIQLASDRPYSKLIFQSVSDSREILPDAKRLRSPSGSPTPKINSELILMDMQFNNDNTSSV